VTVVLVHKDIVCDANVRHRRDGGQGGSSLFCVSRCGYCCVAKAKVFIWPACASCASWGRMRRTEGSLDIATGRRAAAAEGAEAEAGEAARGSEERWLSRRDVDRGGAAGSRHEADAKGFRPQVGR